MAPQSDSEDEEVWTLLAGAAEADAEAANDPAALTATAPPPTRPPEPSPSADAPSPTDAGRPPPADPPPGVAAAPVAAAEAVVAAAPAACSGRAVASRPAARGNRVPAELLEDPELNAAIASGLPLSYNFDVHRTVWRLRRCEARHVGLQMPEGLQEWALTLCDILRRFVPSVQATTIFGDVSFGACCIDDLGARAVGVDFLVHYGHSCLVPTDQTTVTTMYVHVDVRIDVDHLVETVRANFSPEKRLALLGSVQFSPGIVEASKRLQEDYFIGGKVAAQVPQVKPLSVGETLGCTSPQVSGDADAVVFVCDGRFHLESAMIQNPGVKGGFYRYDPFYKTLTRESFAHADMHRQRRAAIEAARGARTVGLILSTLGRQGSIGVLEGVEKLLEQRGVAHLTVLLSDVSPDRLARFEGVDAWVQVACPRLSIDWGEAFATPMLTPYEAHVAFGDTPYAEVYPMDYYSNRGGPWSNYGANSGHGGSLGTKFRHLGSKRLVGYEEEAT